MLRAAHLVATVIVAAVALACGTPAPSSSQTLASPIILAAAEAAFGGFDPVAMVGGVNGGQQCRPTERGRVVTGAGPTATVHRDWLIVCPRPVSDRNVYFLLDDAITTSLSRRTTDQISSRHEWPGNSQDPIMSEWTVKAGEYVGTIHLVGTNGPGSLSIAVSLDLGPS